MICIIHFLFLEKLTMLTIEFPCKVYIVALITSIHIVTEICPNLLVEI